MILMACLFSVSHVLRWNGGIDLHGCERRIWLSNWRRFSCWERNFLGMLCLGSEIRKSPHSCGRKVLCPWLDHLQSVSRAVLSFSCKAFSVFSSTASFIQYPGEAAGEQEKVTKP